MEEKSEKMSEVVITSKNPNTILNNQNKNQKEINNENINQFMEFPEIQEEDDEDLKQEDPNFGLLQEIKENLGQLKEDKEIKNKNFEKEKHTSNITFTEATFTTNLFKIIKENEPSITNVVSSVKLNCSL